MISEKVHKVNVFEAIFSHKFFSWAFRTPRGQPYFFRTQSPFFRFRVNVFGKLSWRQKFEKLASFGRFDDICHLIGQSFPRLGLKTASFLARPNEDIFFHDRLIYDCAPTFFDVLLLGDHFKTQVNFVNWETMFVISSVKFFPRVGL